MQPRYSLSLHNESRADLALGSHAFVFMDWTHACAFMDSSHASVFMAGRRIPRRWRRYRSRMRRSRCPHWLRAARCQDVPEMYPRYSRDTAEMWPG